LHGLKKSEVTILMLEKSHKLTRILTKYYFLLYAALLLVMAIINGYSYQFVADKFLKGENHTNRKN